MRFSKSFHERGSPGPVVRLLVKPDAGPMPGQIFQMTGPILCVDMNMWLHSAFGSSFFINFT